MTELKMKEMQLINWLGCPNLIYARERIHLAAMLVTDAEMKKNLYRVCRFLAREEIAYRYPIMYEMIRRMFSPDDTTPPEACAMFMDLTLKIAGRTSVYEEKGKEAGNEHTTAVLETLNSKQSQARPMVKTWPQIEEVLVGVVESTLGGADINETLESAKAEIEAIGK